MFFFLVETNCEGWKVKGMEDNTYAQISLYGVTSRWVYCNVEGDEAFTEISEYCCRHNPYFMLNLLKIIFKKLAT